MTNIASFSAAALYELAKSLHPKGVVDEAFIPVEIEGQPMELRYFTDRGDGSDVELSFFRADARYARRSIIVWQDGRIDPTDDGVLPESDKREGERPATLSAEDLARAAFAALQRF
ncbi:hypothetical protein LMG22037_05800 [Paraburkholderia phenoliruptrix]|uniref:Uncharacterized protein n=1 Tax=Paraburkholderia phenoliruptrix TaxID=252970 RepID=A0A6J5CE13_9BURK|nr:hypothetical protein [Paraburkholderia phenoliruptrix]CAB3733458.1 hypothetical protein LMG22037_05800 [Paraburkholderia phenoliruptrix]